jgi:hypothetical protein
MTTVVASLSRLKIGRDGFALGVFDGSYLERQVHVDAKRLDYSRRSEFRIDVNGNRRVACRRLDANLDYGTPLPTARNSCRRLDGY